GEELDINSLCAAFCGAVSDTLVPRVEMALKQTGRDKLAVAGGVSIIGFTEFFAIHKTVVGATYLYFPSAAIEMVGYLTMTVIASVLLRWAEKKMDGADSYELVEEDALTMSAGTYRHPKKGSNFDERHIADDQRERTRLALKNRNGSMRGDR
ncbi:MAG: hypothetical protein IIY04_05625, partial [Oscillospiraceae bacterium]|nr:hypothetical protein [Oscillospiraceae bacterium]